MINGLQDILLNIFIIISPVLIYHVFFAGRDLTNKTKHWLFIIIGSLQIILSLTFPISIIPGYRFDLRQVPIFLGFLYGGNRIGVLLFFVFAFFRYIDGGNGIIGALSLNLILSILLILFNRKEHSEKAKLGMTILLTFITSLDILINFLTFYTWDPKIPLVVTYLFFTQSCVLLLTFSTITAMKTINSLNEKIKKNGKYEIVSHLAASISHEIRNPLTVSRGFIQMLRATTKGKEKEYVELALAEMDRAQQIINDYLTFAKPNIRETKTIRVMKQMEKVIRIMNLLANMNNVSIAINLKDNFLFKGDEAKLTQWSI